MGAAVDGIDIVREAEHRVAVGVVVLEADFHAQRAAVRQFAIALEVNWLVVKNALAFIQQLDELGDTAFEVECFDAGWFLALVS